jgi:hypothetical protein
MPRLAIMLMRFRQRPLPALELAFRTVADRPDLAIHLQAVAGLARRFGVADLLASERHDFYRHTSHERYIS